MTSLKIKFLQLRMHLGLDPWARAAKRRYDASQLDYAKQRIRLKAQTNEAQATTRAIQEGVVVPIGNGDRLMVNVERFATDTIIAKPVRGESVIDLKSRAKNNEPERSLTAVTADGIEVQVYDPTDEATAALMQKFGMGDVEDHHRSETFGARCENAASPEDVLKWEGEAPDPFEGIKRL